MGGEDPYLEIMVTTSNQTDPLKPGRYLVDADADPVGIGLAPPKAGLK